jgi:tetraacyldisaccharide 4'-kinase
MIRNRFLRGPVWPIAIVYEGVVRLRAACYRSGVFKSVRVTPRVVSVGNLTVGGAGKTPFTIRLAELIRQQGRSVAVLSRGYKRKSRISTILVSDGEKILANAQSSGDEASLIARRLSRIPVVAGSPKWRAAQWLESKLNVEWIVLDDGFQHLKLLRDRNILLLDAERPFDNGQLIPLGRLREPLSAVSRASVVVLVGDSAQKPVDKILKEKLRLLCPLAPVFTAHREGIGVSTLEGQKIAPTESLAGMKLFAFCGLARSEQFFQDLKTQGLKLADQTAFADHHQYRASDARRILTRASAAGAEALITTAKDATKLSPRAFGNWLCYVYEIKMVIDDEAELIKAVLD